MPRREMAIELGRTHVRALVAVRRQRSLAVHATFEAAIPADLDRNDAAAVGAWLKDELKSAGVRGGPVTLAIAREHVGLKRLRLPTTENDELPEMTRLAMQRELPFNADQAVIDFVPLERTDHATNVLAVAAPQPIIDQARAVMKAAGLSIGRIALRAMGSAALIESLDGNRVSCVLAIDIGPSSVEFAVLEDDAIRFSRAAELRDAEDRADAVVTETRRTWMSYRIVEGASEVKHVVMLGDRETTQHATPRITEILNVRADAPNDHLLIDARGHALDRFWPLAGLLLEPGLGRETINFARPRKPVDPYARRRRRIMLAAGAGLVAIFSLWTFAQRDLADLEDHRDALREQRSSLMPRYIAHFRDVYQVDHLRTWANIRVDWLDHLRFLLSVLPDPGLAVIDSWAGSLAFRGVEFHENAASKEAQWTAPHEVVFVLDGEAKDRLTADALRNALVRTHWYETSSLGADSKGGRRLPFGFTYRMQTSGDSPPSADIATAAEPTQDEAVDSEAVARSAGTDGAP